MLRTWITAAIALAGCGRIRFGDNHGSSDASSPDVPSPIVAAFEAESGQLTALFATLPEPTASGSAYMLDGNPDGTTGPGQARYGFTIDGRSSSYHVWARTLAPDTASDSFFLQIDALSELDFTTSMCTPVAGWIWVPVLDFSYSTDPTVFALAAGAHTLVLRSREGQSKIDRFVITDDPAFVPSD